MSEGDYSEEPEDPQAYFRKQLEEQKKKREQEEEEARQREAKHAVNATATDASGNNFGFAPSFSVNIDALKQPAWNQQGNPNQPPWMQQQQPWGGAPPGQWGAPQQGGWGGPQQPPWGGPPQQQQGNWGWQQQGQWGGPPQGGFGGPQGGWGGYPPQQGGYGPPQQGGGWGNQGGFAGFGGIGGGFQLPPGMNPPFMGGIGLGGGSGPGGNIGGKGVVVVGLGDESAVDGEVQELAQKHKGEVEKKLNKTFGEYRVEKSKILLGGGLIYLLRVQASPDVLDIRIVKKLDGTTELVSCRSGINIGNILELF